MEQRRVEQREHRRNSNNFLAWLSSKNCVPVVLHVSVRNVHHLFESNTSAKGQS